MSELWKGFAGLVAAFGLAFFISQMNDLRNEEYALINTTSPIEQANQAYEEGKIVFYRVWNTRNDEKGNPYGYWLFRGAKAIDPEMLAKYPERYDLSSTVHKGVNAELIHFNKKAKNWTLEYNLHLAKLLLAPARS